MPRGDTMLRWISTMLRWGHVGELFKKIQVDQFFIKIIESPLYMPIKIGLPTDRKF